MNDMFNGILNGILNGAREKYAVQREAKEAAKAARGTYIPTQYIVDGKPLSHTEFISFMKKNGFYNNRSNQSHLEVLAKNAEKGNERAISLFNRIQVVPAHYE